MNTPRIVTSPGESYLREMTLALERASSFVLISAFATVGGVESIAPAIRGLLERGGSGRIIVAVDRQGFNTAATFEALLAMLEGHAPRLSLGIVLQGTALLHAKALYTESAEGPSLLIGSANLTKAALGTNHELGLVVDQLPGDLRKKFLLFVNSIAPRSLDGPDARTFLEQHGLVTKPPTPKPVKPSEKSPNLAHTIARLPPCAPLEIPGEAHLSEWIQAGYLIGRGRRTLDALVLRLPQEQLVHHGFIQRAKELKLGKSSHETQSTGYGVDLIPTQHAEALRRDARRVSLLISKMSLNLPCFGMWMPKSYWEVFVAARDALANAESLSPDHVEALAETHRKDLETGGLERELDTILTRLDELKILLPGKRNDARAFLLPRLTQALALRSPRVLSACVEFRTARQCWSPYEQTDRPFRQLMGDIVQATFTSTYRTGGWPSMFRSLPAREIATAIANRLEKNGIPADAAAAISILDEASTWDDPSRPFPEVIEQLRKLIPDALEFSPPKLDDLIKTSTTESDDEDA
jgi:HKD family nuclease